MPRRAVAVPWFRKTAPRAGARERVFAALVEPGLLNQWVASAATVEPRAGGAYSYGWTYAVGELQVAGGPTRILALVPNERLVTDWPDWRGDPDAPPTTATWLLEPLGNKTRLTLLHAGFARGGSVRLPVRLARLRRPARRAVRAQPLTAHHN